MNEAELLFSGILNCDRLSLYLNKGSFIGKDKCALISSAMQRRISGEPVQYILGKSEFMGLEFKVTPDVLIPRSETEILVETVLEFSRRYASGGEPLKIMDLGTGSGNIAVSLAKLLSGLDVVSITATDISKKAIEVARYNALLNNVVDKISFIQSDLFTNDELAVSSYDIIVSNPPYISDLEIDNLQAEVRHEPRIALDGGRDGLDYYRRIVNHAPYYLEEGGLLIMEIGYNQKDAVENIFKAAGGFRISEVIPDYNSIDRVIVAEKRRKNG